MSRRNVTSRRLRKPQKERALDLVRRAGVLRPRDRDAEAIPREYLRRLLDEGSLGDVLKEDHEYEGLRLYS